MPLDAPPLDDNGEVLPHDHLGIQSNDGLVRRISPQFLVYDEKIQGRRLSSLAFAPSSGERGGMSVDIQRLIEEDGLDPKVYVLSPPWIGAVRFVAGALRAEGLKVGYHPLADNPYHGEVWGAFSKKLKRKLQAIADEFVPVAD